MAKATRRQQGEGSLFQRKRDGYWIAVADLGQHAGKRDRREFTGRTPEIAMEARAKFLEKRRAGFTLPKGRQITVAEWCEHWLINVAEPRVAPTTFYGSYDSKVRMHVIPFFSKTLLVQLDEEDIEAWHRHLRKSLSPASITQCHRILSSAIKTAVVRGRIARNPVANVHPPRSDHEAAVPTAEETARVLERCRTWENGCRWLLAIATGARQGEMLALRWSDVKLTEPASVTISRSAARVKGELTYKKPKSRQSRRTVQIGPSAVAALKAHRKAQMDRQMAAGRWEESDLVFTLPHNGKPVYPRWDYGNWHALLDDLGIRHYPVHSLRHATATLLLEEGQDAKVVQAVLGHATAAFTQQKYQHVRPVLHQAAADAMDRIIRGG